MSEEKTKQYDKIIEREKELEEKKREAEMSSGVSDEEKDVLNYKTYVTGLLKGRITDVEYNTSSILVLTVSTVEGDIEVRVRDKGGYSEKNELVRLLEWKDIPDGQVGDLLDEQITIKAEEPIFDREKNVESIDFKVHVPKHLDAVGKSVFHMDSSLRRFGLTNFEDIYTTETDIFMKVLGGMMIGCFAAIVFLVSVLITIPITSTFGGASVLLPIFMTIFVGIELRFMNDMYRRYKNYRAKDAIQD